MKIKKTTKILLPAAIMYFVLFLLSCNTMNSNPGNGDIFRIGSDNSDDVILKLKSLTGLTIKEIERRARPCRYTNWEYCSDKGFLGPKEKFIQRLLADNKLVHKMGLTHQEISKPLFFMRNLDNRYCKKVPSKTGRMARCIYNGNTYSVLVLCTRGIQVSIFNDALRSNCIVTIDKIVMGRSIGRLVYDADLLPHYVKLYGFYEGGTPYRVAPERIVSFFDILGVKGNK